MKNFAIYLMLFLALLNCSGPQNGSQLNSAPHPYTVDVLPAPTIDTDAYRVVLPTLQDAAIRIPLADGGTTGINGEQIVPLTQGRPAPFPGVLFNGPAVARIEVEFRASTTRCDIDRQADIDRLSERSVRDIRLLQTTLNTQAESYSLMIRSRDTELNRVYQQLQRAPQGNLPTEILIGIGSLLAGGAIGLGVGLSRH